MVAVALVVVGVLIVVVLMVLVVILIVAVVVVTEVLSSNLHKYDFSLSSHFNRTSYEKPFRQIHFQKLANHLLKAIFSFYYRYQR